MRWCYEILIVAAAIVSWGCSEEGVASSVLRTDGICAYFELVGNGTDTEVTAVLKVGDDGPGAKVVEAIDGDDELVVTSGDESRTMSGGHGDYSVTMSGSADEQLFTIAFNRDSEENGAPETIATLPVGFTLSGIASGEVISRGEGATVTWDPSGTDDDMFWLLDGDCLLETSGQLGDTGSIDITASHYDVRVGKEQTTCEATLVIERQRLGSLDSHYSESGGGVLAIQRRSITFLSAP